MQRMDDNMPFLLQYEHVAWYEDGKVRILDRRVYPTQLRFVECSSYREVAQAVADPLGAAARLEEETRPGSTAAEEKYAPQAAQSAQESAQNADGELAARQAENAAQAAADALAQEKAAQDADTLTGEEAAQRADAQAVSEAALA